MVMMITQPCEYTKNHRLALFKEVICVVYES